MVQQADTALSVRAHSYFVFSQIAVLDDHTLFHRLLVELFKEVELRSIFWLCLPLIVQERGVVIWHFLVLNIAENVEKFLVVLLCILDLFLAIVLQIAVRAPLSRLVGLILLGAHSHHIFDALLEDSAFDILNPDDELE